MKRILLATICILSVTGCGSYDNEIEILNVQKKEVFTLERNEGADSVHSFRIKGKGQINGAATISLMLNGEPYKTEHLSGKVSFKWGGDWYSDTAVVVYEPLQVNSGSLVLRYSLVSSGFGS